MEKFKSLFTFSRNYSFKNTLKNYFRVIFIWCPIVTILFILGFDGGDNLARRFSTSMIIASTVATFCFFGSWLFNYPYSLYRQKRKQEPKIDGIFWGVLISFPFLLPGLYFGFALAGQFNKAIGYAWQSPKFSDYSSGVIFGIMVTGLFTLFEVVRESKQEKQAAELKFRTLENEKLKAQISALSAQMNPHLLFNSLNTIASTISTDAKSAEDMVVQLSELYRGILKSAKGDFHLLENELLLCQSYLNIEQKRFGSRVDYRITIDKLIDPKRVTIPVLLIQPLVENAIKHGIEPKREGGKISININSSGSNLEIHVVDNGVGINHTKSTNGTGTGLSNCESRVKLHYGETSKFSLSRNNNETIVSILIPLKEVLCD